MGDRANIGIKYSTGEVIYLYTHWLGSEVENIVNEAIAEGRRLTDEAYFARILFSKMIARGWEGLEGESGFGIAPYKPDQDFGNPVVMVDFSQGTPTPQVEVLHGEFA